jgi:hypothetical protein
MRHMQELRPPGFSAMLFRWIGGDLKFSASCEGKYLSFSLQSGEFCIVYHKPTNKSQLILKRRTQTEVYVVLARAWQAANDKARELGCIV